MERQQRQGISYFTGGQGTAVLMLHGIPGSAYSWHTVGQRLSEQYRVIIPDLVGFGESEKPAHEFYMEEHAHALADFLEAEHVTECVICVHDFGGPVALTLMRLYPQLRVSALVISNTNLFTDTFVPLPLKIAKVPGLGWHFYHLAFGTRVGIRMLHLAAAKQKDAAPWDSFRRHLTRNGLRSTAEVFYRSLKDLEGNYRAVEETLKSLDIPVLVLWAGSDPLFGADVGERVAAAVPGAKLIAYPQSGHFVPEEQPDRVSEDITSFLRER